MNEERFAGMFWWDWPTFIYTSREDALQDTGFNIHKKSAENVVKSVYNLNRR